MRDKFLLKTELDYKMTGNIVLLFLLLFSSGTALQMTGPSTHTASVGSIAHIPCTFTADKLPADPKYFAIIWYLNGKKILSYDNTVKSNDPRYTLNEDRALNGIADLTISNIFPSDSGEFVCSVIYSPFTVNTEIRVEVADGGLQMTGPSTHIARVGSIAHIPCTFTADKLPADPKYFAVFWYLKGNKILSYDNIVRSTDPRYSLDEDRALNGIADLIISNTSVSDGGVFTCSVNYSSFLMEKEIRVDVLAKPSLSILSKSFQRNSENTLTCTASGFFPSDDIVVKWYKDGEVLEHQFMGEPQINDKGAYDVNNTVTIPPSDDNNKKSFSCRIQHVSLQEPLQEEFHLSYSNINIHHGFNWESSSSSHFVIIGIVIGVVLLIIIVAVAVILLRKRTTKRKESRNVSGALDEECKRLSGVQKPIDLSYQDTHTPIKSKHITGQHLLHLEMNDIEVPELIEGEKAILKCQIRCYDTPKVKWYIKMSSHDKFNEIHTRCWIQNIERHKSLPDTYTATLKLYQVQKSHEGSEFLCKVDPSDPRRVIEKCTGPVTVHVKDPLPEIGEIFVSELIEGEMATLSSKVDNYISDKHAISWHVKLKSTGDIMDATSDEGNNTSDDENTCISNLTTQPLQKSDDGLEFILRVSYPGGVIEKSTGPLHVKGKLQDPREE